MSEQLKHIFDKSACLSKRQLKDYTSGVMTQEESHALEHHLNSCFFCSEAIEGIVDNQETAMAASESLNNTFLKDHFSQINPQVHLNSIAPSAAATPVFASRRQRNHHKTQPLIRTSSIAAVIIMGVGLIWYVEHGKNDLKRNVMASSALATTTQDASPVSNEEQAAYAAAGNTTTPSKQNPSGNSEQPEGGGAQRLQPLLLTDQVKMPDPGSAGKNERPEVADSKSDAKESESKNVKKSGSSDYGETQGMIALATAKGPDKVPPAVAKEDDSSDESDITDADGKAQKAAKQVKQDPSPDALYFDGKWSKALAGYRKEMNSSDAKRRQQATVMAARCQLNLGQKEAAIKLLKSLIDEGGSQKKTAQRMLHDLQPDAGE